MMLFLIGFGCGVAVALLVVVAASYLWPDPERSSTQPVQPTDRDPRAPAGINEIEYWGWKSRRDIADAFISRMDAGKGRG